MNQFESVADYLPESVQGIIAVIGLPATEKLIRAYGGTVIKFSRAYACFDRLREVLGQDDAIKLQQYMGGSEIYIPRCETALRMLRDQRIYVDFCRLTDQDRLSGRAAMVQICATYQVCDRTAWRAVNCFQAGGKSQQASLF